MPQIHSMATSSLLGFPPVPQHYRFHLLAHPQVKCHPAEDRALHFRVPSHAAIFPPPLCASCFVHGCPKPLHCGMTCRTRHIPIPLDRYLQQSPTPSPHAVRGCLFVAILVLHRLHEVLALSCWEYLNCQLEALMSLKRGVFVQKRWLVVLDVPCSADLVCARTLQET